MVGYATSKELKVKTVGENKMSRATKITDVLEASAKQKEYQAFFKTVLKKYNVKSPNELDDKKKKEFFDYIEKTWTKDKEE